MERFLFARDLPRLSCHDPFAALHSPEDVPAKEQEKITDRRKNEQARMPGADEQLVGVTDPGEEGKPFYFDREDEEDIEHKIRIQKSKGQEDRAANEHVRCRVHRQQEGHGHGDDISDKKEEVVPKCSPVAFECRPHKIEHVPGEERKDGIRERRDEQERDEPPPFAHENQVRDEHNAFKDEPAGKLENEKEHLAEDNVQGHIGDRIAMQFSIEVVQETHGSLQFQSQKYNHGLRRETSTSSVESLGRVAHHERIFVNNYNITSVRPEPVEG
jgi:hypothetical protein